MKILNLILLLLFFSCAKNDKKTHSNNKHTASVLKNTEIETFHKLRKLFCVGDFDGDGKRDTIFQYNFSKLKKEEIINAPDPAKNEWENVIKWFMDQDSDVYLAFNKKKLDTLHLGTAQGLYCLINIGDNNLDGRDEIALVVDNLDFSNLNSCKIYSICKGKWLELKQFNINESAFDIVEDAQTTFSNIPDYLEKKDDKWYYTDNLENEKMQLLKIEKCR
ncbi:hypothetical protein ACFSJW_24675 [Flavobacterium artemisiae]|uniref:VCBS repeat-containing protein n=1 Tax=Flavobacterium artemisiae TaxID=2126556 RepID=A0ABW4HBM4_9FLAO